MATFVTSDGCEIRYQIDGGEGRAPLILSNSLGTDLAMWDDQVAAFSHGYQVIRYDSRGHGQSSVPAGPYSIDRLGLDALELADHLGLQAFNWCGLSKGGMVGLWLGTHAGGRLRRLVVSNTAAYAGPPQKWADRVAQVQRGGMDSIRDGVIQLWFTEGFRAREPDAAARIAAMLSATDPDGYVGCCQAIAAMDQRATIAAIKTPTLVIAGRHDPSTPPDNGREIAASVSGAQFELLDAAHLSNIEQMAAFNAAVLSFLAA